MDEVRQLKDKEQLKTMWEKFVFRRELDPNLNELVKQSWSRSVSYGVNCLQDKGAVMLQPEQLEQILRAKRELLAISLPLMQSLYSFVKDSGFLVILCDENGTLLKVIGDESTLREARDIRFVEGAVWSEEMMGTNAIGTCIKVDQPLQIYAAEHFFANLSVLDLFRIPDSRSEWEYNRGSEYVGTVWESASSHIRHDRVGGGGDRESTAAA